jgi:hypothetical protein
MKIELTHYQENEDGSANCYVEMDKEATHSLVNFALVTMLSKAVEEGKLYSPEFYEAEEEEEEEVDVNYFYDEDEDIEYYYVEEEDAWYYYDECDDDWFIVEDEEDDGTVWLTLEEEEELEASFVNELKSCLINTYNNSYLIFPDDIDYNIHIRNACKTLLGHYMISSEATAYLDEVAATYEC